MNYIGCKYKLLPEIDKILEEGNVPKTGLALDCFSGTGTVSQYLKKRGHKVYANDWQAYSYYTTKAFIELSEIPDFEYFCRVYPKINEFNDCDSDLDIRKYSIYDRKSSLRKEDGAFRVLNLLNSLVNNSKGKFFEEYCDGGSKGRLYFTFSNGSRIESIRSKIEEWLLNRYINSREYSWLLACLLESADRVANVASVYASYLKYIKLSAAISMDLIAIDPIYGDSNCRSYRWDVLEFIHTYKSQVDPFVLTYLDPPYNRRQYNSNYHILETIALWDLDEFTPKGVTGLRDTSKNNSAFCKKYADKSLSLLLEKISSEYILLSYSNQGSIPEEKLRLIVKDMLIDVIFKEIDHKRFRSDSDYEGRSYSGDRTKEFLILGRNNRA